MTTPLITRLEEAAEGSRELDAMIWAHFRPEKIKVTGWIKPYADDSGRTQVEFELPPKRTRTVTNVPGPFPHAEPVTSSLDAALALAERLHPCWSWSVGQNVHHKYWLAYALVLDDYRSSFQPTNGMAKTPALALCLAILKANHKDKP